MPTTLWWVIAACSAWHRGEVARQQRGKVAIRVRGCYGYDMMRPIYAREVQERPHSSIQYMLEQLQVVLKWLLFIYFVIFGA